MNYLKAAILFITFICYNAYSQSPPSDFKLVGTTGGATPLNASETITILADGEVNFFRLNGGISPVVLLDTNFLINASNVQQIWQSVQNNNYFSLNSNYKDTTIQAGSLALFTITADGTTKQVSIINAEQNEIQNIIASVNSNIPADYNLNYLPPKKINTVLTDPCSQTSGSIHSLSKKNFSQKYSDKSISDNESVAPFNDVIQIPHPPVEVGYEISLAEAIKTGRASLSSKGNYFGDGVSITGNYPEVLPPPPNAPLKIKLNLEFYGPCDNSANESKIINEIKEVWNGQKTSNGETIEMEINTPTTHHYGADSPIGTPGYDQIELNCDLPLPSWAAMGTPNSDEVAVGVFNPSDPPSLIAMSAGNLMGLKLQTDTWFKNPDGDFWQTGDDRVSYPDALSNKDFTDLYNSKWGTNYDPSFFKKLTYSYTPSVNHENDLMGNPNATPLQSDIDSLAAKAGLIIVIEPGDILVNFYDQDQNEIVTHSENLFIEHKGDLIVKPGEGKTLNGIYTACIDRYRGSPGSGGVFNIAPSLDKWNGSAAAEDLLKLLKYIDSTGFYCGEYQTVQHAIWRITNDLLWGFGEEEDIAHLFEAAGIDVGNKIYNFPRLSNTVNDTSSKVVFPKELFMPDIQPKSVLAEIGENLSFNAEIYKPDGVNYTTNTSWIFDPPDVSSSQITSNGSFTPDTKGIYAVSVKIDITDSLNNTTEYDPEAKAYAVVPDKFTETFEHANLDWFHWDTYGDSKWEITDKDALTGTYSVRSGEISDFQSTSLSISVNLPKDTSITFAVKMLASSTSSLNFYVDSSLYALWGEGSGNWEIYSDFIRAGEHKLTWTVENFFGGVGRAWIDDIFFPANSVVTSINSDKQQVPAAFKLYQNYPNPFNPATIISYQIPIRSNVSIKIYDILGNEIATLLNETKEAGYYKVKFDGSYLSSGIYFYKLRAGNFIQTKKMILLR